VVQLFAYPITETELGNIEAHPGFKQFVCVPFSPTFIPPEESLSFTVSQPFRIEWLGEHNSMKLIINVLTENYTIVSGPIGDLNKFIHNDSHCSKHCPICIVR